MSGGPRVADYFVVAGAENLRKPDGDAETLEPITDLAIIFKSLGETPPPGFECIDLTPSGLAADLNYGSLRSQTCFLCYRRGRDKPPLTDVGVLYEGRQRLMPSCGIVTKTPTDLSANVNNAGNMRIFITFRRAAPQFAHSSLAVIDIAVIIASKGEKPPHAFCLIDKNLNQGLVGSDVYLCYRKSLARTNSVSYKAEIISRYPLNDHAEFSLPDSIPLFCLPLGAVVECWPEKAQPPLPIFSTFALTGLKGEKIYGAGITFFEELPEELFSEEVKDMLNNQQELNQDGGKSVAHTNKCICLLSHYPFFDSFRKFLISLYRLSVSGPQSVPLERYISHFMTNVFFPTPQRPRVQVLMSHESFDIVEPSHGPLPISGASHAALLRCLGPENVLILFYCALAEQKILIHSLRPALLTSVGEAITSLLFPFVWQCPYIPLCPLALADVLSAPCPFIYGIDSRYFDRSSPPDDVTCVDLDTNMVTQAIQDPRDPKVVNWKLLPKKPGKILKDKLDELYSKLFHVFNEDNVDRAVDMAPIEADGSAAQRKEALETSVQEAFLRFHSTILKGYRQYLLPITSQPTTESCDLNKIFDAQGFLKSRPREYQRFFSLVLKTQHFSHFVQQRSFASTNDVLLAFFDECTEKCDNGKPLLQCETPSQRTSVIPAPDSRGLPIDAVYDYSGFPKLKPELFVQEDGENSNLKVANFRTPPRSPVVSRTKHERDIGTMSAKKQSNSPTLWARCLLGHCYAIWFIHLPAYVKAHHDKGKALHTAFEVLQRIAEQRAQLPDEVCFRVLMQLAGQFSHPALAVKVLFEMKRQKVTANAITWGYYHRAVIDGKWVSEHQSAKELWSKLRNTVLAMNAFKKALLRVRPDLIHFTIVADNPGVSKVTNETASEGTGSDAGYSSLLSTEDLTRPQPVAGGLAEFPSEFPEMPAKDNHNHHQIFSKGHRRVHSASEMSEPESEGNADFLGSSSAHPWFNRGNLTRHLSETSIGSNLSDSPGSNQIIISHSGSWQDPYQFTKDSYEDPDNRFLFRNKSDIGIEAMMGTSQSCKNCNRILYDEEIMGGWSADDSNWNTVCPFCQDKQVPYLQVKLKDYRGLQSKVCSTSSLYSESSSVSHSFSSAIDINDDAGEGSSLLTREVSDSIPLSPPTMPLLQDTASSKPMPIKGKRFSRDVMMSTSAPASGSSSPLPGYRNSPRQQFYRVRKSSSSNSFTLFVGSPDEKQTTTVPYLSPLVLRKELENLLANDGDIALQDCDVVLKKPILFWNMVWYFRRLGLTSHLPDLILQSLKQTEKTNEEQSRSGSRVIISTSWDNERPDSNNVSLYMLWNLPEDQQDALTDRGLTSRSVLKSVAAHIQDNDVASPMTILLDERSKQKAINPKTHWSLYRELMFLSLTACGTDNIDAEAFDREYKNAYKSLHRESADLLQIDDKPPTGKAFWCRRAFQQPTLQPRLPNLSFVNRE